MREDQHTEFKRIWKDDYLKELCAFANSQGGVLYLGVDDNGKVLELKNLNALLENLPNKIHANIGFFADVNRLTDMATGLDYIGITIQPQQEAISYNGKYYIRSGSTTQELRGQELATFLMHKTKTHWDELPEPRATLADLDYKKIEWFVGMAREKRGVSWEYSEENIPTILTNIEVLREDGQLNNAALLLFAKNPQKWFINSYIKCASFPTTKMVKPLLSHQMYGGNVFELVDKAVEFVSSRINASVSERTRGAAADIEYELPLQALTEAVVNAVVHRDYMSTASVQVMLFRDRLEVWNPGTLPIGMTIEKLCSKHRSIPVNPKLARAMFFAGYIDELGTGTTDMIDRCVEKGLRCPDFTEDGDFEITLWRPEKAEAGQDTGHETGQDIMQEVLRKLEERGIRLSKYQKVVLSAVVKSPNITKEQISARYGIVLDTVVTCVQALQKKGVLATKTNMRSGTWDLLI